MIKIDLDSEGRRIEGTIQVHGDEESLTNEIYIIIRTLFSECPVPFEDAVDRHLQEIDGEE